MSWYNYFMKKTLRQKGTITSIIITIIAIIIAGGVMFYFGKNGVPKFISSLSTKGTLKTYTDIENFISFQYPSNLIITKTKSKETLTLSEVSIAEINTPSLPIGLLSVIYYPDYIEELKGISPEYIGTTKQKRNIYRITSPRDNNNYLIMYYDSNDNPSIFIMIKVASNTDEIVLNNINYILDTITIDEVKVKQSGSYMIASARLKGQQAYIKANLSNIRAQSELIYDKKSSYSDVCKTSTTEKNSLSNSQTLTSITDIVGSSNLTCRAKNDAWMISVIMPGDMIWCADSTGVMSEVKVIPSGYICKAK